ncbi:tetratricopeptide repeat protein [uncultured Amphritea sp.]|uniref:tetratricopeptide repeat protein n=1 Tax=uncultured Amphritea sp. TaxID=981605 RepID=UPI00261C239C|nr:tetratricopeptide repeat protein [uncultured Amphritea sp.]
MKKVITTGCGLLLTSLLAGCMGGNANINPIVEDRSAPGNGVTVDQNVGSDVAVTTPVDTGQGFTVINSQVAAPTPVANSNPAIIALLQGAREQQKQGDYSAAQSSLERAQRIDPRDPHVYLRLADLRRQQGQYLQAEQFALKGLTLARGKSGLERKLWFLIADIRSEGGDHSGAADARDKANLY